MIKYFLSMNLIIIHMKKISNIIIDFCKKQKIYCINANEKLNFLTEDTYDLVHLTPKVQKKYQNYYLIN